MGLASFNLMRKRQAEKEAQKAIQEQPVEQKEPPKKCGRKPKNATD